MQRNSPRNVNTASSEYPWDFYLRGHDEPIISESVNDNQDARLKNLFREACPLFDRLGRAMADMSTQMWNYVEPGSVRQNHHNRPIDPMGSFESRIMSLLRERYVNGMFNIFFNFELGLLLRHLSELFVLL